jgi:FxsC-like protein
VDFAKVLVDAAESYELRGEYEIPPIKDVQSAFHAEPEKIPETPSISKREKGPRHAKFVFVAGKRDEMETIRTNLNCYGNERREWRPYQGDQTCSVEFLSQGATQSEGISYRFLPFDDQLLDQMREAEGDNNLVIIVVDPWVMQLQNNNYKKLMMDYDEGTFLNSGVIIPWNLADEETEVNQTKLRGGITEVFLRNIIHGNSVLRDNIQSKDEFEMELRKVINQIRLRIARSSELSRPVRSENSIPTVSAKV